MRIPLLFFLYFHILLVNSLSNLTCISMPMLGQFTISHYFICTCPEERMDGHFSLASFVQNLPRSMAGVSLAVDLRNCWSLDIIMDQMELAVPDSDYFRPDIELERINIENSRQVETMTAQSPSLYFLYNSCCLA